MKGMNMSWKQFRIAALSAATMLAAGSAARAAVFFTDGFSYADGQLTAADATMINGTGANVSGGNWVNHSGQNGNFIQVVSGAAELLQPGAEDANRDTGSTLAYGGNTWYYGLKFTVTDTRPTSGTGTINPVYFIHFKESPLSAQFRGRLYLTAGANAANFSLGLSSSSVATGNGAIVPLGSDLLFGTQYTAMVSYTSDDNDTNAALTMDGFSSLWVNPVSQASPSVTDMSPNTNITGDATNPMKTLAIRQSATSGQNGPAKIALDVVSIGDSFSDVLAGLSPAPANNSDFNSDGIVDGADFIILQQGFGLTGQTGKTNGNANADTVVDGADLAIFKSKYGGPPATAAASAVPEPASIATCLFGVAALATMRRRGA